MDPQNSRWRHPSPLPRLFWPAGVNGDAGMKHSAQVIEGMAGRYLGVDGMVSAG